MVYKESNHSALPFFWGKVNWLGKFFLISSECKLASMGFFSWVVRQLPPGCRLLSRFAIGSKLTNPLGLVFHLSYQGIEKNVWTTQQ